ncbi:ACP S-malonyltransferase [Actinomadura gamaensis]|uniref:[acyl-carrier-protein] S-malonyltransferase n=1 Tax=Actinomadura gamaensis TaxID=1763541 RepID=A0ABV9UCF9_9ACTN
MVRTALMFPGLGAFFPAAFRYHSTARRIAVETAAQIDPVVCEYGLAPVGPSLLDGEPLDTAPGSPVADTESTDAETTDTGIADTMVLAVYAAEITCYRVLREEGRIAGDVLIGHSLGEYAALVAAGAFSVADGARLLCERSASLRRCRIPPGAMLAVSVSRRYAERWARQAEDVVVAAVNGPEQVVLSGREDEILALQARLTSEGHAATLLRTGRLPHHHPLLTKAYLDYTWRVQSVAQEPLRRAVHSPLLRRRYRACDDLRQALALQMILPVDFLGAVTELRGDGIEDFIECGLRCALTNLLSVAAPDARAAAPFRMRTTPHDLRNALDALRPALQEDP